MIGSMFRKAWYSDSATLNLDFTTGVLDSRLTFTRSSTGTYIDSSGYVASASIDSPRFDHDPTTLAPRGLLIEGQATNLALNSNAMASGSYTAALGATKTANAGTAPDNSNDAARVTFTQQFSNLNQPISTTAGTTYTVSFWVKLETGNASLRIYHQFSATSNSTAITATTSWQRVSVSVLGRTGNGNIEFGIIDTNTSGWGSVLVWGFQVETGSGASSLIPTGASQATRDPDNCVMTGTDFSSWFNASEGTFLARFRPLVQTAGGLANTIVSANDNTANEQIALASITNGRLVVIDGGSVLANVTSGTVTLGSVARLAGAYKLDDCQSCTGGTLGTADTSVTLPTVDRLFIGRSAGASPTFLRGHIESFKFYPTRLPNATLQSLTT